MKPIKSTLLFMALLLFGHVCSAQKAGSAIRGKIFETFQGEKYWLDSIGYDESAAGSILTLNANKTVIGKTPAQLGTMINAFSGTYTPTLSDTTNIITDTARLCTYFRVGNSVTVSGQFTIDPRNTATQTVVGFSLPIASNFTTIYQAGGTAGAMTIAGEAGGFQANATADKVELRFISGTAANHKVAFTFTYTIL